MLFNANPASKLLGALVLALAATTSMAYEYDTAADHEVKTVNGYSVVVDKTYNLMWERKSADPGASNYAGRSFTFDEAEAYVALLNANRYAGRTDWRVPSVQEWGTLVDLGQGPNRLAIDEQAFPNMGKRWYWADSQFDDLLPSMQRMVSFLHGNVFVWPRTARLGVMAVAGGGWVGRYDAANPYVPSRYAVDAEKTTVTDKVTGLQWEQQQPTGTGSVADNAVYTAREVINLAAFSTAYVALLGNFQEDLGADTSMSTSLLDGTALGDLLLHVIGASPDTISALTRMLADAASSPGAGSPFGPHSWIQHYTFAEAQAYIDYLNNKDGKGDPGGYAGHKDWRLPTADELLTITDQSRAQWPLVMPVFTPSSPMGYWTGEVNPVTDRHYFIHGLMVLESLPDGYALNVRAVRGRMKPIVHQGSSVVEGSAGDASLGSGGGAMGLELLPLWLLALIRARRGKSSSRTDSLVVGARDAS